MALVLDPGSSTGVTGGVPGGLIPHWWGTGNTDPPPGWISKDTGVAVKSLAPHWRFWGLCPRGPRLPQLLAFPVRSSSRLMVTLWGGGWGPVLATSAGAWASGGCTAQIGAGDAGGKATRPCAPLAPNLSRRE